MGIFILLGVALICIIAICSTGIIQSMRVPPRKTYGSALARSLPTTPKEAGFDYQEYTVTYRDGTTTIVWEVDMGGPEDLAVIFTHSFGDSRYGSMSWASLFRGLVGKVFVYDTRAHGDSTAKRGSYTAKERDDLIELMDMLVLPSRVVLMGCSMGAVISISAAGLLNQRVVGLICDGPYRKAMEPIIGYMWQHRWPPYPFVWPVDWHLRVWLRNYQPFDRVAQIKKITCPLMILHGTDDPICLFKSAKLLIQKSPTPSTLITFEGGRHLNLAKCYQEKYIGALQKFLTDLGQPSPENKRQKSESQDSPLNLQPLTPNS